MPFLAVQLHAVKLTTALEKVTENVFVFIRTGKEVETFSFCPDGNPQANPYWEQMFADDLGKFGTEPATFQVHRVAVDKGQLGLGESTATIVAQLRYEYALNLVQRLAGTLSRIGLSFRGRGQ
jgi:hypothetical protein